MCSLPMHSLCELIFCWGGSCHREAAMATPAGSDDSTGQNDAGAQSHNTAVILRCSPFFTASLEGWPRVRLLPSFETPRKRAAPQDDGWMGGSITHVSTIAITCPSATTSSILTSSD